MSTKKLLVAFNPKKPTSKSSDFLFPLIVDGHPKFLGLSSGKYFEYGMVVMTGKEVTENDVFAKIVDLGRKVENVDQMLGEISEYLAMFKNYKISNVLKVVDNSSESRGFSLEKTNLRSSPARKGLP
jgi:hypothetical protein